jgi:hypothetical protein
MASKKKQQSIPKHPDTKERRIPSSAPAPNRPGAPSAPGQEQDVKRRLGNFVGAGEHARVGDRTAGIVGQTKRAFQTDHKRTKSKASMSKPDKSR